MKSIVFMRHSFAENAYNKPDFEREILAGGFDKIEQQALSLKSKNIVFDCVISSSAVRTQQTCRYILQKMKLNITPILEDWIYHDYTTADFLQYIQHISDEYQQLLFVGHNPSISVLAAQMNDSDFFAFQPASVLKLNFNIDSWQDIQARSGKVDFFLS